MNSKFIFALLLICLAALTARAQIVSGVVVDEQNAAIANVETSLNANGKTIANAKTNDEGRFALETNGAGKFFLRVRAVNFADFEQKFTEQNQFQTPLEIVLAPAPLNAAVTITGTETRLAETPASVVVLNRETLEQTAAQTVDDALRQVPGFGLFRRSSSRTTNPTAQGANLLGVGGSGASRAAVLLDGVSLNDAFGGWTYWSRVPRAAVREVEILRGAASSLYGSAALSGAINIATERGDKPILRVETSSGTQKTADGSAFGAFGKNGWSASVAFESFQTAGYFPVAENQRGAIDRRSDSRHNNGFLTIERRFNENRRVFARGNLFAERRDNGTSLQTNRTYFRQAVAGFDFNSFVFRAAIETQIYNQTFSSISADRNAENLNRLQRVPSQAARFSVGWNRVFAESHTVSAFAETREVRGASDETVLSNGGSTALVGAGGRERSSGVSAQDFWRVNSKLNLNFGGRFDFWRNARGLSVTKTLTGNGQSAVLNFPDRNENAFSPRVAALYQITNNFSLNAAVSKSFRAPTLNELYRAFRVGNVLTQANENLHAERLTNGEIGFLIQGLANKFSLRGNLFWATVSRPVVSLTLSATPNLITRQRQNVGKTESRGLTIDTEFQIRKDLRLSAGYFLTAAKIIEFPANPALINLRLPQVPRRQFTFQAFYRPQNRFSFGLQSRVSSSQFDDDQNLFRLNAAFSLDVFGGFRVSKKIELFAAAENLTNNRFDIGRTPILTVAAPLFVRVGLRFTLK